MLTPAWTGGRLLPSPLSPPPSLAEPLHSSVLKLGPQGLQAGEPQPAESGGWRGTELSNLHTPLPAPFITLTGVKNNRLISLN